MRAQIFKTWDRIRSSFWFLPAIMAGGAMLLAFVAVSFDTAVTDWLTKSLGWTFNGGAEGASSLLGTIAGSMITIAGVVFSMTLVALSLASSQFGPRLLKNFMRDTSTQMVLGTFIATFLYCLIVLRTIRRVEEAAFVPHLSVSVGVLLAIISVWVLIYFIHHVSVSIRANEIVARVAKDLFSGIEQLFPENIGSAASTVVTEPPSQNFVDRCEKDGQSICSTGDGYLQFIDGNALMELATQEDIVIKLMRRPGHYVANGCPLALVWSADNITDELVNKISSEFALGNERTSGQDIEFAVEQLVEIAVRALSPGINDPFTAVACVDHLGSVLCRLAQRDMPSPYRYDTHDQLRMITPIFTFANITDAALNQIRQYGRTSTAVTIRLLETIAEVARFVSRAEDRKALLRHASMISRGARGGLLEYEDRQEVDDRFQYVNKLLSE